MKNALTRKLLFTLATALALSANACCSFGARPATAWVTRPASLTLVPVQPSYGPAAYECPAGLLPDGYVLVRGEAGDALQPLCRAALYGG